MIKNPIVVGGTKLPTLTNPGTAADLLAGKQLIDADGNSLTGTMPEVVQATPSISVSSAGLITASATQTAGHVTAGTKSATKQLTTKAAATITPGTADQVIPAETYLTGAQTIKGNAILGQVYTNSLIKSIAFVPGSSSSSDSSKGTLTINLTQSVSDLLCAHFVVTQPSSDSNFMVISIGKYDSKYYAFGSQIAYFIFTEAAFYGSYFTVSADNNLFAKLSSGVEKDVLGSPYQHCIYIP